MEYSGAGRKLIHEKNQKQKISWHCPFNWDPFSGATTANSFHGCGVVKLKKGHFNIMSRHRVENIIYLWLALELAPSPLPLAPAPKPRYYSSNGWLTSPSLCLSFICVTGRGFAIVCWQCIRLWNLCIRQQTKASQIHTPPSPLLFHTAKTQYRNSKQIFPEKELCGLSPNFYIHVSVSDWHILTIGLPILLQENMLTGPGNCT